MIAKELRNRKDEELRSLLTEARTKLFEARIKNATHQLDDSSSIAKSRKEIARIITILGARQNASKGQE